MQHKHDPTRRKKLPLALAVVPDRKLGTLGAYVVFAEKFRVKGVTILPGNKGLIVADKKFLCKPDEVAVKVPWLIVQGMPYLCVPLKVLEVQRVKR